MKLEGRAKMLRVHIGENDRWEGKPLYRAIVEACREMDIAGATVFRGVEGYGASTLIHRRHRIGFSSDAPLLVSVVDTAEKIAKLLPALERMVSGGMVAISDVEVVRYTHEDGKRA